MLVDCRTGGCPIERTGDAEDYERDYRAPVGDVVRGAGLHEIAGVRHVVWIIPVFAVEETMLSSVGGE